MYITELITNENKLVHISKVDDADFKRITIKRYLFNWKKLKNECEIYKLTLIDSDDILGLIVLIDYPEEERTEIKLLTSSVENIGKGKIYDRIAGCLIAFAGKEAIKKHKNYPALSLVPKTEIKLHYIKKYGMLDAGWQLYLADILLLNVIKKYLP
jgi:hypothetical protein